MFPSHRCVEGISISLGNKVDLDNNSALHICALGDAGGGEARDSDDGANSSEDAITLDLASDCGVVDVDGNIASGGRGGRRGRGGRGGGGRGRGRGRWRGRRGRVGVGRRRWG